MTETKVEIIANNELTLVSEASEDRSRGFGRTHRLLTMLAAGFVFLALCLLLVDFRRLDHSVREARPVKLSEKMSPR